MLSAVEDDGVEGTVELTVAADGAATGEQQHAQRFLTLACTRQRQHLARKR